MSKINRQPKSVTEAVEPDTLTSTGYKFKLSASFYPEVIKSVLRFKGHPANDYAWEEKGAKHVESSVWDDKRQYTGNLIHNANGELLTLQLIFGGKTSRSLPTAHVDIERNWIMGFSPNHWSNLPRYPSATMG